MSDGRFVESERRWIYDRLSFYSALTSNKKARVKISSIEAIFFLDGVCTAWFHTSQDGYLARRPTCDLNSDNIDMYVTEHFSNPSEHLVIAHHHGVSRFVKPYEIQKLLKTIEGNTTSQAVIQIFPQPMIDTRFICTFTRGSTPSISNVMNLKFTHSLVKPCSETRGSVFHEPKQEIPSQSLIDKSIQRALASMMSYADKYLGAIISGCSCEFYLGQHSTLHFLFVQVVSWSVPHTQIVSLVDQFQPTTISSSRTSPAPPSSPKSPLPSSRPTSRPISAPSSRLTMTPSPSTFQQNKYTSTRMTTTAAPSRPQSTRPTSARILSRGSMTRTSSTSSIVPVGPIDITDILKDQIDETKREMISLTALMSSQQTALKSALDKVKDSAQIVAHQEIAIEMTREELRERAADSHKVAEKLDYISDLKDQLESNFAEEKSKQIEDLVDKELQITMIEQERVKLAAELQQVMDEYTTFTQSNSGGNFQKDKLLRQIMKLETRIVVLQSKKNELQLALKQEQANVERLQRQYKVTTNRISARHSNESKQKVDTEKVEIVEVNIDDLFSTNPGMSVLTMSLEIQDHIHRHKDTLHQIFAYYSLFGSSQVKKSDDVDAKINLSQFNRFAKDCRLNFSRPGLVDRCFIRTYRGLDHPTDYVKGVNPISRCLSYDQFIEAIIRLSVSRFPEPKNVAESLSLFLTAHVIPYAYRMRREYIEIEMSQPEIHEIFEQNSAILQSIFQVFCSAKFAKETPPSDSQDANMTVPNPHPNGGFTRHQGSPSRPKPLHISQRSFMSLRQFIKLVIDFGVTEKGLSMTHAIHCFVQSCQHAIIHPNVENMDDEKRMTYSEFKEALYRVATITHKTKEGTIKMLQSFFEDFLTQDNIDIARVAGIPLPTTSTERRKKERLRKLLQSIEKEEEDVFSPTAAASTPTKKTAATPRPTTVSGGFAQQLQASTTPKRQSIW